MGTYQTFAFGGIGHSREDWPDYFLFSNRWGGRGFAERRRMAKPTLHGWGKGTVTDNLTRLIWLKNANAFGVRTWEQALSDANTLASGSAGLTDGSVAGIGACQM